MSDDERDARQRSTPAGRRSEERENRRNYYRILHVQPDAPAAVIRASYRALLQRMRIHPDLGGAHRDASLINEAYAVLRHPERRRRYDAQLLARYGIVQLSMGWGRGGRTGTAPGPGNQRNYYRVLQVQRDAPVPLVEASFQALVRATGGADALLREAFAVLRDPAVRALYDRLLRQHRHPEAVRRLGRLVPRRARPTVRRPLPRPEAERPTIVHYCPFCKTPARLLRPGPDQERWCVECHSPLPPEGDPTARPLAAAGRDATRLARLGLVRLYADWPSTPLAAEVRDLSPTGARIGVPAEIEPATVLKVESDHFRALARVVRCRPGEAGHEIGVTFLSAHFDRRDGNFLSFVI